MSLEFLLTSIVVILIPGTGVLYTLAVGLGQGAQRSFIAALGCTLGIVPHVIASIAGIAAILHTSALAFQAIKYLGVIYLFYMAWKTLREGDTLSVSESSEKTGAWLLIRNGVLLNVLNPKLSLFFLAFLPQFISNSSSKGTIQMITLALVFMLLTFMVFIAYGWCASLARDQVLARPAVLRWMRRSFAAAFGLLGIKLAFSER